MTTSIAGRTVSVVSLAEFFVGQPSAVATLLAQHADDGRGHCRVCGEGTQRGFLTWPCMIYSAALAAATRGAASQEVTR